MELGLCYSRRYPLPSEKSEMLRFRPAPFLVLFMLAFAASACSSDAAVVGIDQSGGATGVQEIQKATEILKFDPASIPLNDSEPVSGTCGASTAAPGAYRCELADASVVEPCFVLSDARLLCDPDPVAGDVQTLVDHAGPLPQVPAQPLDRQVQFFIELADGRTCQLRTTPEPVVIGGIVALFDCNEPYTYVLGIEQAAPLWEAAVFTLDPATGQSPSGKVPVDVVRAWIP